MQNLVRVTGISLILLMIMTIFGPTSELTPVHLPQWLVKLHQNLLVQFTYPQNAHFLFSLLTGDKKGLSWHLLRDLDHLNLRFLLSPSGLHLSGFLFFMKKGKKRLPFYLACWFLPHFYSLKRLALLRFLSLFNRKIKFIKLNFPYIALQYQTGFR